MKKIIAFLQNAWFYPQTSKITIYRYSIDPDYRRKVLALSRTGKNLQKATKEYYEQIVWHEANWRHGNESKANTKADIDYMKAVILTEQPDIILLFGNEAQKLIGFYNPEKCYSFPHPTARGGLFNQSDVYQTLTKAISQ
jgi:hypothetical protein